MAIHGQQILIAPWLLEFRKSMGFFRNDSACHQRSWRPWQKMVPGWVLQCGSTSGQHFAPGRWADFGPHRLWSSHVPATGSAAKAHFSKLGSKNIPKNILKCCAFSSKCTAVFFNTSSKRGSPIFPNTNSFSCEFFFFFNVHPVFGWEDFRLKLARLILALAERNPGEVARYESDLGRQEF